MDDARAIGERCALRALEAGREIRRAVHAMPPIERGRPSTAAIKPAGAPALFVDRAAEEIGIARLEQLSREIGRRILLIADLPGGEVLSLGSAAAAEVVFAHLDAVDGTIKVGGLGNDFAAGKVRIANDGAWAVAASFTAPTRAAPEALTLGDFVAAAVVDGNPPEQRTYPAAVVTLPDGDGPVAYDASDLPPGATAVAGAPRVFTSTTARLCQSVLYYDGFQAYDRATRRPGDEALAVELYRWFINRNEDGAFDLVRQYGSLSGLLRVMLGWRGDPVWIESQGAGFVALNENLANLIPAVAIVAGAGGISVDFDDRPLRARRLVDGRTSVVHAANAEMRRALLAVIARARRQLAAHL